MRAVTPATPRRPSRTLAAEEQCPSARRGCTCTLPLRFSRLPDSRAARGHWRAVVLLGLILGDGIRTTLGAWDLGGLMNQPDAIYPSGSAEPARE
jgi:hypothetical protein